MTADEERDAERLCILFCDSLPAQTLAEKAAYYGLPVIYFERYFEKREVKAA